MREKYYLFIVIFFAMLISSCNNDITLCEESSTVQSGIGFYTLSSGQQQDTTLPQLSVIARGAMQDSLYSQEALSNIDLPLNENADSSIFSLQPDGTGIADTLRIRYKRQLTFLSPGCGFVTFFTIDTVITTHHHIDSVAIVSKKVINLNAENIQLYY